jgi:hypothetical protein
MLNDGKIVACRNLSINDSTLSFKVYSDNIYHSEALNNILLYREKCNRRSLRKIAKCHNHKIVNDVSVRIKKSDYFIELKRTKSNKRFIIEEGTNLYFLTDKNEEYYDRGVFAQVYTITEDSIIFKFVNEKSLSVYYEKCALDDIRYFGFRTFANYTGSVLLKATIIPTTFIFLVLFKLPDTGALLYLNKHFTLYTNKYIGSTSNIIETYPYLQ